VTGLKQIANQDHVYAMDATLSLLFSPLPAPAIAPHRAAHSKTSALQP